MAALMQQEVGGQMAKFLADPAAYHYALNAEGKRIAGHTGKVSTAFGPFGILESTGAQPGYGVKPLADKSIGEQIRFAADYLAARSKRGGSLLAGLAGYGEGARYAQQVQARLGVPAGGSTSRPAPMPVPEVQVAAAPIPAPPIEVPGPEMPAPAGIPVAEASPPPSLPVGRATEADGDPWLAFLNHMRQGQPAGQAPVTVGDLQFGEALPTLNVNPVQFQAPVVASARPNFEAFGTWGRRA